jgi:hypothetical protein
MLRNDGFRPILVMLFVTTVAYVAIAVTLPPAIVQTAMHAISFAAWVAVAIVYAPGVAQIIRERASSMGDILNVGIFLSAISVSSTRGWAAFYRILGRPSWMFENPIFGGLIAIGIAAAILHLMAPGAINDRVPKRGWIRVGVAIGIGIALAVFLIWAGVATDGEIQATPK